MDYNPRRNLSVQFFGTGSNHTTTIIIIVVCAAAGILILYCLFRFFRHSWARYSTPLPPMQPIALYREQRLTEFVERRNGSTAYSQTSYHSPSLGLSPAASNSSLLPVTEDVMFPPRKSSLYTAEKGDVQGVQSPPAREDEVLRTPDSVFGQSSSSLHSTPSTPPSASVASSPQSQATLPYSHSHRDRTTSAVSRSSHRSARSSGRSAIIGVPHGPHSQVQVILPSPLAPSLHPYMSGAQADRLGVDSSRASVHASLVDMWARPLHRSASSDHIGSNTPTVPDTHWRGSSSSNTRRRTSSYHASSSPYHSSSAGPPAVPPIPTQYNTRVS